jgi:hypothetical protein
MTATVEVPDVAKLLEVTDRRFTKRAGDDPAPPEYIGVLAQAVQQHIATLLPAAGGGAVDTTEVDRLRAELGVVTRERDTHARALEKQAAPLKSMQQAVTKTNGEIAELQAKLAAAEQTAATLRAEESAVLKAALADRDEARRLLEEKPAAVTLGHQHRYEWPGPKTAPKRCSCDKEYPRGLIRRETGKASAPEPFDDLFANIRVQLSADPRWSA